MRAYSTRLWPDVSSPAARRVLTHLFNHYGSYTDLDFPDEIVRIQYEQRIERLSEMWFKVEASDIAQRLAAGPALLPDICEALPQPWAALYRLARPRTLEQQVHRVVQHLEWYLAAQREPRPPVNLVQACAAPALLLVVVLLAVGYAAATGTLPTLVTIGASIAAFVALRLGPALLRSVLDSYGPGTLRRNATVLYHHLRRAYADAEEPKPGL